MRPIASPHRKTPFHRRLGPVLMAAGLGLSLALSPLSPALARGAPESFADLAAEISPSVVNITTTAVVPGSAEGPMVPPGSPFEEFFKDFGGGDGPGDFGQAPPQRSEALGSGFVISADGFIVTNNHVIEGADEIEIEFYSGERLKAKLVGTDPKTDIALLKVESPQALPFVSFGDSDEMRVGDWVMAMGNPLGQGFSVSAGIVSARGRELQGSYDDFLQTDAAINKGNSGGPLFNMEGEVIGVNTAILSPTGGSIGIGFSMASNVVAKVVDQLKQFGETRRGWLGVRIQDVTQDVADAMGLAEAKGALISEVMDGPAKAAGILAGDVILTFNGEEISDARDLTRTVADAPIGEEVAVSLLREGTETEVTVKLGRREDAEGGTGEEGAPTPEAQAPASLLGLTVEPLTPDVAEQLGLDRGASGLAISAVDPASDAAAKGLSVGDVIVEAGQARVSTPKELEAKLAEAREAGRKSILLLVRRGGDPRFVALALD